MVEEIPFQKIVVPLDGSRWAEKAIPHAEQIARGGGELILLHVFKPAGSQYLSDAALARQTQHIDQARRNAEHYVKELRSKITSQSINVSAHVVESRDLTQAVCNFVASEGADVVVMPAASHGWLARVLMGDIVSQISGCVNACMLLVRGISKRNGMKNRQERWRRVTQTQRPMRLPRPLRQNRRFCLSSLPRSIMPVC